MNTYIAGVDRAQTLLLPERVEEYVRADNPVRFLDAYVDGLDLVTLGFEHALPNTPGRPPYHPGTLIRLYLYGYLNKIRSSRQLEAATHKNLELIWLLRKSHPDFKTIADFRKNNLKAVSSQKRNNTKDNPRRTLEQIDRKITAYLQDLNAPNDLGQLHNMAAQAKEILGVEQIDVAADKGYFNTEEIKKMCRRRHSPLCAATSPIPKPPTRTLYR